MAFPPVIARSRAEPEAILEPDLPICDTHFHVAPKYSYSLQNFLEDATNGHRVVTSVYAETLNNHYRETGPEHLRTVGEIEFVAGLREQTAAGPVRVAEGIVGYVDLTRGAETIETLDASIAAGRGGLKGIRINASWDETGSLPISRQETGPDLYARPDFRAGLVEAAKRGLTFDAWQYSPQLPTLIDLIRTYPDFHYVLDHCGGMICTGAYTPRDEMFKTWRADMRELSQFPNVMVKISGLANWVSGFDFHSRPVEASSEEMAAAWRPYFDTCVDFFGPQRCMFASNFPVESPATSYRTQWNAFKILTASMSADEKLRMYLGTAQEFYRLDASHPGD
jgi:predicted TIM-barrel fold metal-dependent hydrolase